MEIRNVTWQGWGVKHSMPVPEFYVMNMWDAINYFHWANTEITFAEVSRTVNEFTHSIQDLFNDAEKAEIERRFELRVAERGCR